MRQGINAITAERAPDLILKLCEPAGPPAKKGSLSTFLPPPPHFDVLSHAPQLK